MGKKFKKVVQGHETANTQDNWGNILYGKKTCKRILTREDVRNLRTKFRKNFFCRDGLFK